MSLLITDLPTDPELWASWLEKHLFSDRLRELIAELAQTLDDSTRPNLEDLLTSQQIAAVRASGLSALESADLLVLMGAPQALLQLEEDLLMEGGEYWDATLRSTPHDLDGKSIVESAILEYQGPSEPVKQTKASGEPGAARKTLYGLAALAAAICIGIFLRGTTTTDGPELTGILGDAAEIGKDARTPDEFFDAMATSCDAWFEQSPQLDSKSDLKPILETLNGNFVELVKSNPLSGDEKEWFKIKCEAWQKKVTDVIAELDSNAIDAKTGRESVDKIITAMANKLSTGPTEEELQAIRDAQA